MSHCGHVCVVADTLDRTLTLNSHGVLDSLKSPLPLVEHRVKYYQFTISALLESIGVPTEKLHFVLGSSFQKSPEYIMDVYKLSTLVSEHDARRAGAEIVKQSDSNTALSGLIYPILQVLDEHYLGVDGQFGGMVSLFKIICETALAQLKFRTSGNSLSRQRTGFLSLDTNRYAAKPPTSIQR